MKYNDQIYGLSEEAYRKTTLSKNEETMIKNKQKALLKILFEKFQKELKSKESVDDGILKVRFKSKWYSDFNDGYREIDELVESKNFNSFASEYCMYIGKIEYMCDEWHDAYYEVIWDYKTYFEQMGMHPDANKNHNQHEMSILSSASVVIPKLKEVDRTNDLAIASQLFSKEKAMTLGRKKNNKR